MAQSVVGISLNSRLVRDADRLAKRRRLSRSGLVASLLERELAREQNGSALEVVIEGQRFVPAVK